MYDSGTRSDIAQQGYENAQARFQQYLLSLKAAGKSADAAKLESAIGASKTANGISGRLDAAMQAAFQSYQAGNVNAAVQEYKQAVDLAEKIQPHDPRLAVALGELGNLTSALKRFDDANAIFLRQLKAAEELSGPQSPALSKPLQNAGMNAVRQKDYASAEKYLGRALDLAEKNFGPASEPVATSLRIMSLLYYSQKDYAKAEPFLVRAVKIDETLYGHDGPNAIPNLNILCSVYDRGNEPVKAADCHAHMLAILEKQYGPDNLILVATLTSEAKAFRATGHNEEATKIEARIKSIQATAQNKN
jgi:tetratricopeptide (TPR) repeat protein